MFEKIVYQKNNILDPLDIIVSDSIKALKEKKQIIKYPNDLTLETWPSMYSEIDKLNAKLFNTIKNKAGVYAILEQINNDIHLKYIGQTDSTGSRQRIRSHLVWRNKKTKSGKYTGSQFDNIQHIILNNGVILLSFVEIMPPSLRHYIESKLLDYYSPEWNTHGVPNADDIHRLRSVWSI